MDMRLLQKLDHIAEALGDQCEKRKVWLLCGFSAVYLVGTCLVAARKPMWNDELFTFYISRLPSVSDIWSVLSTVDSALLGCYLSGANGRRIRGALSALLRSAPLSKSAISRIVGRLQALFTEWRKRSLKGESVVFLYLDAIALRVRIANRVVSAPVLVAVGVKADGQKGVLDLELLGSESSEC
jgi:Transposase, Mutator family